MRLGYVGHSRVLREIGVYVGRTVTLDRLREIGGGTTYSAAAIEYLRGLSIANLEDLERIVRFNESIGIRVFRISSGMFPHMGNPAAGFGIASGYVHSEYNIEFARGLLRRIGALVREYGHRITMHPGQFIQLGSPKDDVVRQSIVDIVQHGMILECMGCRVEDGSGMVIHGGGVYGDRASTLTRWKRGYMMVPAEYRGYIVLENDEWNYSVRDLLPVCLEMGIPLCVDFFHHSVQADKYDVWSEIGRVEDTWRGRRMKCHWSTQEHGARPGTHSRMISGIDHRVIEWADRKGVDVMCECKHHEACLLPLLEKYYVREVSQTGRVEWVRKKR